MSALSRLPQHLRKYVVEQHYDRYTPEDQAVWRFIMRQLKEFLSVHAHDCYLDGLKKTGIKIESIPKIEDIDRMLESFGWGAVPVSGFIPPAAFMEFQSLGILPIASDMRSLDHLTYTPAPDIVHEAAGHAPILIHPEFAQYLRKYADVARYAIISKQDMDQYNAIRELSDLKEDPSSTPADIRACEEKLTAINLAMSETSEAALLSRMNWWTAEYGLIGEIAKPKIYGAGLLSSVGESRKCLSERVKKIPLDVNCIDFSYDITEQQPQLFVATDFHALHAVLDDLATRMSFRRGGVYGLEQAKKAQSVNTVQLDSGVQISGVLESFMVNQKGEPVFVKFSGPCQLSCDGQEIPDQGVSRHAHGFSSPLGPIKTSDLKQGENVRLEYDSGIVIEGKLKTIRREGSRLQILTFVPCRMTKGTELLFDPAWGEFDLAVGETIPSVFGGPADRTKYGDLDDFAPKRVPPRKLSDEAKRRFQLFSKIRECRETSNKTAWPKLVDEVAKDSSLPWLMSLELLEMGYAFGYASNTEFHKLKENLDPNKIQNQELRQSLTDGLKIAHRLQ
jgi:phenylalanine-4-hydroxylase